MTRSIYYQKISLAQQWLLLFAETVCLTTSLETHQFLRFLKHK